jgi:hypothetical protein
VRAVERPPGFDWSALPGFAPWGAIPVVAPCFMLCDFVLPGAILEPVPALPWSEAPGPGCIGSVWADAIAVAPNREAATRAEIASLDRMRNLLLLVL